MAALHAVSLRAFKQQVRAMYFGGIRIEIPVVVWLCQAARLMAEKAKGWQCYDCDL